MKISEIDEYFYYANGMYPLGLPVRKSLSKLISLFRFASFWYN
ncbi:hypothetical protein ZPR_0237 [Zunongwangia profunda SM-A87]|uniref:Uncharacterized protein n=1 Tax=Zunongwangia profunda (strain DSM 18752 / CCTCC AB 206139 / SM-A87) TaxID=655815 RepID=D5BCT5_ZUNPS|nr:hypothetical protein ZPR_0237 [Zunongwangia profunda SM-A87]